MCWAYSTSRIFLDEHLQARIIRALLRLGRDLDGLVNDQTKNLASLTYVSTAPDQMNKQWGSKFDQPYILSEGPHWFALYKPPFWEVNTPMHQTAGVGTATPLKDDEEADTDIETLSNEGR